VSSREQLCVLTLCLLATLGIVMYVYSSTSQTVAGINSRLCAIEQPLGIERSMCGDHP
jgi:hypothetical protein